KRRPTIVNNCIINKLWKASPGQILFGRRVDLSRMRRNNTKLEILKKEKEGVDGKLAGFLIASKDLVNLIESQRADKNKDGLRYSAVPPHPAQIYSPPKKDLSWTGLPEFVDDTVIDYSRPSLTIESTSERSTKNKVETVKKHSFKYAELYQKTTKRSTIRGNQRNWNNLKSQQLGENFVRKNRACFNYGHFDHLSYDCGLGVKMGRSSPKNNCTHMRSKLEDSVRTKRSRGTRNLKIQKLNIKFRGGLLGSKSI
nr:ubiquitin hydrolase [Tanacetum cinerariifolium]